MTSGRYRRHNSPLRSTNARRTDRENNFFLAMLGCSLAVHLLAAAIFSHDPPVPVLRKPPTVYVDLVLAPPVANPQRGSGSAISRSAAPVVADAPVAAKKTPTLPTRIAKDVVVSKGKGARIEPPEKEDDGIAEAMAKMKRRKAEQDELKSTLAAIAAMKKTATPAPAKAAAATVSGSASGSGDEAGSAIDAWLQKEVKAKWSWPDRKRKDLSAEVEVEFDVTGKLSHYRFLRPSSDPRFDDSLKRALLSLQSLPKEMRKPYKETILFNLDDLQGQ